MNKAVDDVPPSQGEASSGYGSRAGGTQVSASSSVRYLLCVAGGMLATLLIFYLVLVGLSKTGHLPPPGFSNSLCIDEKLRFMRENPSESPNLLVIGSSVAWRHFDGATGIANSAGMRPLNGAFCGLPANQSVAVANWLLDRQPTVRQVVMIVAPQDFAECREKGDVPFDMRDADSYVFERASPWPFYLRYFAPVSLVGNARSVKERRADRHSIDPLVFTSFGDGPFDPDESLGGLRYGKPLPLDSACFQAVDALASRLQNEGRQFLVVSTPLHPDWKAREDPDGSFLKNWDAGIVTALEGKNFSYWDADADLHTAPASFIDATHVRWSAAQLFTAALVRKLPVPGGDGSR